MEAYTYEHLRAMNVAQLREVAAGLQHEGLEGYLTMHKERLLPAICAALGIHAHHAIVGAQKTRIKAEIRKLKGRRDQAVVSRDRTQLSRARHNIHVLKHKLRLMATKNARGRG